MNRRIGEIRNEDRREMALVATGQGIMALEKEFRARAPKEFAHWQWGREQIVFAEIECVSAEDADAFLREYPKHALPLGWRFLTIVDWPT